MILALAAMAGVSRAAPPEPVAATEEPRVLSYVPADAHVALLVRMDDLVRTDLWRTFAAQEVGLWQTVKAMIPAGVDLEKDVTCGAVVFEFAAEAAGGVRQGLILELNRDVRAEQLVPAGAMPRMFERIGAPVYEPAPGWLLVMPQPRLLICATADYLPRVATWPQADRAGPLPVAALSAGGEVTFAARMAPAYRDALVEARDSARRRLGAPEASGEELLQMGAAQAAASLADDRLAAIGRLNLSRQADALAIDVTMPDERSAIVLAGLAQMLADPLWAYLPRIVGGKTLSPLRSDAIVTARPSGQGVRIVMSRDAVTDAVGQIARTRRTIEAERAVRAKSAENLRQLGIAARAYAAQRGQWPKAWADLVTAGLIENAEILANPALKHHLPTGDYALVPMTPEAAGKRSWEKVLAFEIYPDDARPAELNVLFAGGQVDGIDYETFQTLYAQTLRSLAR